MELTFNSRPPLHTSPHKHAQMWLFQTLFLSGLQIRLRPHYASVHGYAANCCHHSLSVWNLYHRAGQRSSGGFCVKVTTTSYRVVVWVCGKVELIFQSVLTTCKCLTLQPATESSVGHWRSDWRCNHSSKRLVTLLRQASCSCSF